MPVFIKKYPDTETQYVVYRLYLNNTMLEQDKYKKSIFEG